MGIEKGFQGIRRHGATGRRVPIPDDPIGFTARQMIKARGIDHIDERPPDIG
jgi:hypothetical protein